MHNLTDFEWLSLFALFVAWWVNPFDGKWFGSRKARTKYRDLTTSIPKCPGWIISILWFLMYSLVAVSMWFYLNFARQKTHDRTLYDATLAIGLIVNYLLVKTLYYVFFVRGYYLYSVVHAILVCLSACAVEVLIWIHFGNNDNNIVAGILYAVYALWTIATVIRTIDVAYNNQSMGFFNDYEELGLGIPSTTPSTARMQGRNAWNARLQQRQRGRMARSPV
jgi:hypothetical protein